jgi:hypothetical protein
MQDVAERSHASVLFGGRAAVLRKVGLKKRWRLGTPIWRFVKWRDVACNGWVRRGALALMYRFETENSNLVGTPDSHELGIGEIP